MTGHKPDVWNYQYQLKLLILCRPVDDARVLLEAPDLLGPCETSMQGIFHKAKYNDKSS